MASAVTGMDHIDEMTFSGAKLSIIQRALGSDFSELHPRVQEQYGISSQCGRSFIGEGVMDEIWHGARHVRPFLALGRKRRLMFREIGEQVPFKIRNHAYTDLFGREILTMNREFRFGHIDRRFDEFMVWSEARQRPVIYAGIKMHLAVDLEVSVDSDGSLRVQSGAQRLYEWKVGVPFPLLFAGRAQVRQWYDEQTDRFHVDLAIKNPIWGRIFGYRGWYTGSLRSINPKEDMSDDLPERTESRE